MNPASAYLAGLIKSLDEKEARGGKRSPSEASDMSDSPPVLTRALQRQNAPEMPLERPQIRFSASSHASNDELAPRAVAALWGRFAHLYGFRFENAYGPALAEDGSLKPVAATWAKALAGLHGDDLARGLRACLEKSDGWPPSLPEFLAMCKPLAAPTLLAPYHQLLPRALPQPDSVRAARRARGQAVMSQLKNFLKHGVEPA